MIATTSEVQNKQKYTRLGGRISVLSVILIGYIVLLAIVIKPFTIEGKNLLFIVWAGLGCVYIILVRKKVAASIHPFFWSVPIYLTFSYFLNYFDAKFSSYIYSIFFCLTFFVCVGYIKNLFYGNVTAKIILIVFYAYLAMLLMGQLYITAGLFRGSNIDNGLVHGLFGTLFEAGSGYRFYSFSTEPSYAAFVVIVLFYSYLEITGLKIQDKKGALLCILLMYMLLFFQSGFGIILFFILILFKTTFKNSIILAAVGLMIFFVATLAKQPAAERVFNLITQVDLTSIQSIKSIDYSASFRILPTFYYIKYFDITNYHYLLGFGAGESEKFLIKLLFDVPVESFQGGFFPQFLYDYGLVFGLLFIVFLRLEVLDKTVSFQTVVILLMLTNANFNTQLFWLTLALFALTKHYKLSNQRHQLKTA